MNLSDARETYYFYSGKLSDINRNICFAGIAVVWIFVTKVSTSEIKLEKEFLVPLILFVISLALDLLQYLTSTITWSMFHRIKEKSDIQEDSDFKAPRWFNWPPLIMFYLKVFATISGYAVLLKIITKIIRC